MSTRFSEDTQRIKDPGQEAERACVQSPSQRRISASPMRVGRDGVHPYILLGLVQ